MSYSMSTEVQNKLKEIVLKKKSLSEAQGEVLKVQASVHGTKQWNPRYRFVYISIYAKLIWV